MKNKELLHEKNKGCFFHRYSTVGFIQSKKVNNDF